MNLRFNEAKVTQAAGLVLKLRGGKMKYMKLLKLLYLVDREALLRWGRPVTTDKYVSMDCGPVLSRTLNLINEGAGESVGKIWEEFISSEAKHDVRLVKDTPVDELSRAEEKLITEVFCQYGHANRWDLVKHVHTLPEWQDPHGSAIPIVYEDILRASGKTELEIAAILEELESVARVQACL
jgi:uncharacterized phage-associated protein